MKAQFVRAVLWGMLVACLLFPMRGVALITFGNPVNYSVGNTYAQAAVAIGDFNNDGRPDLAVANTVSNTISILLGNADGAFQAAVNYSVGLDPVSITAVDLNGDNKLDLAVAFHGDVSSLQTGGVSLLLGNGDGTFVAAPSLASSDYPLGIVAGDFNYDYKPDLAISTPTAPNFNPGTGAVSVFLGNGDGTLRAARDHAVTGSANSIAAGDFNGDGYQDLIATTYTSAISSDGLDGNASVLLGNGDGTFQAPTETDMGGGIGGAAIGDFNGDGHLDLAAFIRPTVFSRGQMKVFSGRGDGTFGTGAPLATWGPGSATVSDLNADAIPDLLGSGTAEVLLGHGDGTFELAQKITFSNTFSNLVGTTVVGDFNGDLLPDLAATVPSDNVVAIALNTTRDFTLFSSALTPGTVIAGGSATSMLTLGAANSFTGTISLACLVQPQPRLAPQCSVSPVSANPETPVALTVTTTGPQVGLNSPSRHAALVYALWLPIFGLTFMGTAIGAQQRRRSLLGVALLGLLLAGLFFQAACGGSSSSTQHQSSSGTPKGQYTITVTGTSGSVHHPTRMMLTVQ